MIFNFYFFESMETQLLQTLGKNEVNTIFDFLNPKDFLAASKKILSETQQNQCSNKFKTKKRTNTLEDITYYPVIEYFPDKKGPHCLPLNVKQMFTFETSFYSVKESIGSNLAFLTISNDGDLEIYFDGSIQWDPHTKHFHSTNSLKFSDNYLLGVGTSYFHETRFRLESKALGYTVFRDLKIHTRYIKNEKNSFSGEMIVRHD
jgi:hypothetical protein